MFTIPTDLSVFSVAGLTDLFNVATGELRALRASITDPANATDDESARVTELHTFGLAVKDELTKRNAKIAQFNATEPVELDPPAAQFQAVAAQATEARAANPDVEGVVPQVIEVVTASSTVAAVQTSLPTLADIATQTQANMAALEGEIVDSNAQTTWIGDHHALVAANNIPGVRDGAELNSWNDFAKAFSSRTRTYPGSGQSTKTLQHPIAEIHRNYPAEFTITEGMGEEAMNQVLVRAADETRLDGGSLVAANGWCAPSETLYGTCLQIGSDGMWQGPEVVARRGGIRHNQGIEFDSIFGTGTGFNILTEAQVIADVLKTCVEIPCPPFVDDRLDVSVLCLTGSILQNRAYPEFVETFVRGALATFAHFVNRSVIAQIVAGSVAVTPSTVDPWATDNSLISNLLGIVEMAIVDIRYRLRLDFSTTIEIVLPFWIQSMMRQDFSRRNGFDGVGLTDSQIASWFAMRGARVQYVYDWQDSFSGVVTGPGADTPITTLPALVTPKQVQFLAYPAGTWVLARLDVIRLESIYDSVNLPQNLVTQLFLEDGFKPMRMCPLSRVYTVNICPSGATSALQTVACTDIAP
jgi:hypothetical protein